MWGGDISFSSWIVRSWRRTLVAGWRSMRPTRFGSVRLGHRMNVSSATSKRPALIALFPARVFSQEQASTWFACCSDGTGGDFIAVLGCLAHDKSSKAAASPHPLMVQLHI